MTESVEKIDWTSEVGKLKMTDRSNLEWFSPNPGRYKIEVVEEGDSYTVNGWGTPNNPPKQVTKRRFVIKVNGEDKLYNWGVTLSGSYTSLWGQLVLIGSAWEGLIGKPFTLLVKGDGKKREYTILESLDLMPKKEQKVEETTVE